MLGKVDRSQKKVTVLGGGFSGLISAYYLDRAGFEVTLVEASERLGGLIETRSTLYGIAEAAAHSFLLTDPMRLLCEDLGVELLDVRPDSRARFIWRDGRMRRFPLKFFEVLGVLWRFLWARADEDSERPEYNLADWTLRHLGPAALRYLVSPFVRGIYAVEPEELSLRAAFPALSVPRGKSLFGKLVFGGGRTAGALQGENPPKKERKKMVAPKGGMGALIQALERRLRERLQDTTGSRIVLGCDGRDWLRERGSPENLVICVPAYKASELLRSVEPDLSAALFQVHYTSLVSNTVVVEDSGRPVRGVGVLVAQEETRDCLGILFNSSSFEGRVRDDRRYSSFSVLMGGSPRPDWVEASDEVIQEAVRSELNTMLGVREGVVDISTFRWKRAIPRYDAHLMRTWELARSSWCAKPGHILFGNYTGQVSIRGMVESAERSFSLENA